MKIWCVVKEWKKEKKWKTYHGLARPEDDNLYAVTNYILISEAMLHRSGKKDLKLKKGDRIELEIIAYGSRVFETK